MEPDLLDTLLGLAAGLGLAAACGFRVFVPLLIAGVAARLGWIAPDLDWVATTPALVGLGAATALEIGGYYIPWIDNLLDAVASPAATLAGVLMVATFVVGVDPFIRWTLAIVAGGGAALTVQAATVVTRAASTGTTGGLANPLVATVENALAVLLAALAVLLPFLVALAFALTVALAVWQLRRRRALRALSAHD